MTAPISTRRMPARSLALLGPMLVCAAAGASALPVVKVLQGDHQITTYGSLFPDPIVVRVIDSVTQRPQPNLRLRFTAPAGIGLIASTATTDQYGLAMVMAIGLAPGASEAVVEVEGKPATRVVCQDMVVRKATLTVVPVDVEAHAGEGIPPITHYTLQGFVHGDTPESARVAGEPELTTAATDLNAHAKFPIQGGVGSLSAPNYDFTPGFGTLTVLDPVQETSSGNPSNQALQWFDSPQEAPIPVAAPPEPAAVRPALKGASPAVAIAPPAFVAGLRGQSGVFVKAAIWPSPASGSAQAQDPDKVPAGNQPIAQPPAKAPTFVAGIRETAEPPVRPAIPPKPAPGPESGRLTPAAAAIRDLPLATPTTQPTFVAGIHTPSQAPVRVAFAPPPVAVQPPVAQPEIRRAFSTPGTDLAPAPVSPAAKQPPPAADKPSRARRLWRAARKFTAFGKTP